MVAQFKPQNPVAFHRPPCNIEAEESILGGILLDNGALPRVINILEPHHFYVQAHQRIFETILKLHKEGNPTDFLTVTSRLNDTFLLETVGGIERLSQLLDRTVSAVNIDRHAELVVKKWVQRETISLSYQLADFATGSLGSAEVNQWGQESRLNSTEFLEQIEAKVHELTRSRYRGDLTVDEATRKANQMLDDIREIELNVENTAHKYYKMLVLAKKYGVSEKALETLYYKSLIADEDDPVQIIDDFRKEHANQVNEWFLHGLLPKGSVILLHALGGVGKTRLAYDFCYSLATGTPWGQFPVTAPQRRCLLVQTDETKGDMLRALDGRGFTDGMPMFLKTKWTVDHIASLRNKIIKEKIDVVVIDSLTTVSKSSTFSENDTEYAKPVLQLKDLAQELGITVLLIHHSNSDGKSRGTKAIHNSVSQVLSLAFPSEGSDVTCDKRVLCIEKSRFRRPTKYNLTYVVDEESHQWAWVCEGEALKEPDPNSDTKERIIEALQTHPNTPLEASEILELIGGSIHTIRRSCFQLAMDGIIGRRKSETNARAWVYFLKWEGDGSDHLVNGSDHLGMITLPFRNDAGFDGSDHLITKNEENLETENSKISDQVITSQESNAETVIQKDLQPCKGSDHASDQSSDHFALLPKRSFYPGSNCQYGDRVYFNKDSTRHTFWVIGSVSDKYGKQLIIQDMTGEFFRPVKLSEVSLF